jgi:GNAT superfamily N-acetyltransferase
MKSGQIFSIRVAAVADAAALPRIEFSAGKRYLAIPDLAWLASEVDMPVQTHLRYISLGTEWVAVSEDQDLVGFLAAEIIARNLHIWELAVREDVQNNGIGRRLVDVAVMFAWERRLESVTLTTFIDVPWNAPWYSRLGFEVSPGDERLKALVRAETERGLRRRCAMRRPVHPQNAPFNRRFDRSEGTG